MVTFGEIQELAQGIIIPKQHLDSNYILSYGELTSNKIFPLFKWNKNPNLVINGIQLLKDNNNDITINDIIIQWQELKKIYVKLNTEYIKSKGETIQLISYAEYVLNASNGLCTSEYVGEIHPVYHISNVDWARLENNKLIIDENNEENERYVDITIVYRNGRITKDATVRITQLGNTVSDWKVEKVRIDGIVASSQNTLVSKDGGVIDIIVNKKFKTIYYKEDANGNIVDERKDGKYSFENISTLCTFTSNTTKGIRILGNHIVIDKQEPESEPRTFTVTAHYQGFEESITIDQEKGGTISYETELYFLGTNTRTNTTELPTSIRCDGYIPFEYIKRKFVDGKLFANYHVPIHKMKFLNNINEYTNSFNNEWINVNIEKDNDEKNLIHFQVYETNTSHTESRSCNIVVYGEDENDTLSLTLIQPSLKIMEVNNKLKINGNTDYTLATLPHAHVEFTPCIEYVYEDDSVTEDNVLQEGYSIKYNVSSTNGIAPYHFIPSDFNGQYSLTFSIDLENLPQDDYTFTVKGMLYDKDGSFVCESKELDITYHPLKLIKTYEFSADETEYIWKDNWKDTITIPINSVLHETYTEYVETESVFSDEYKEIKINYDIIPNYDNTHFIIIKDNDNIKITPNTINNTNSDYHDTLTLKQQESGKEITIALVQEHQDNKEILVKVNVKVRKNNNNEEIWSTSSLMYIDDYEGHTIYTLRMSPCWLYDNITEDTIYNGYVILRENLTYTLKSSYFKIQKPQKLSNYNYNFIGDASFDENDKEMTIYIDL